jgi:hypothetical protein
VNFWGVLGDLNQMLAQFIRAQLTLAAFSFVIYIAFMELRVFPTRWCSAPRADCWNSSRWWDPWLPPP